ncbi:MAG: hypothetical protein WD118_02395, partial [Phycisphaeraceae bacterium]
MLCLSVPAQAQVSPLGLAGLSNDGNESQQHDPEAFQNSLQEVIATLENAERRDALLESLRELQRVQGEAAEQGGAVPRQGLLGALAETFTELGDQAEAGQSPVDDWR